MRYTFSYQFHTRVLVLFLASLSFLLFIYICTTLDPPIYEYIYRLGFGHYSARLEETVRLCLIRYHPFIQLCLSLITRLR